MKKSDKSIKNIAIASIKRYTILPFDFKLSRIYENEEQIENQKVSKEIDLDEGEELICSTIINELVWSVLTSRKIITLEGVGKEEHGLEGLTDRDAGDFKGWSKQQYIKGFLQFDDNKTVPYFIETGRASMIMIYGVDTVVKLLRNQEL